MKNIFVVVLLFFSFVGFSQPRSFLVLGKSSQPFAADTSIFDIKNLSFSLNLSDYKNYADKYLLTVYNPTTQLNDHYVNVSDKYYITNTKSFPFNNFDGTKIDSFNPNGASDFGSGVVSGLLNLFFEKF